MTDFTLGMKQIETAADPDICVIWLHGLGAGADDFVPAVPYLKLPEDLRVRFLFPQAPERPVTVNAGIAMPAWYDIVKMLPAREIVPEHLHEAAAGLYALTRKQIAAGIPAERIFWAGFSQGGAVVLEAALNAGRYLEADESLLPAGVMALSTYQALPVDAPHPQADALHFWHAHGTYDDVVPFDMGRKAADDTALRGAETHWHTYPMAHEVCIAELEALGGFIQQRLQV